MINVRKLFNKAVKELYPNGYKCLLCKEELSTNTLYDICDKCMPLLPFNIGKTCLKCSEPIGSMADYCIHCKNEKPYYKKNVSVFLYKRPVDSMIRKLKYDNQKYLANTLGNFIASEVVKLAVNFDVVIPVPLHIDRMIKRGYNQAELLCGTIKTKLMLNVDTEILVKARDTRSQANLSRSERIENLQDSFCVVDKKKIKGKTILLVDDVFTTGSTLTRAAKALHCRELRVISLARR